MPSLEELINHLSSLYCYLEESEEIEISRIKFILREPEKSLDPKHPHHFTAKEGKGWMVTYIGTFLIRDKKVSFDLTAYRDGEVTRFLRQTSSLRFVDAVPELKCLELEEKMNLLLSQHHHRGYEESISPSRKRNYHQRLSSLLERLRQELKQEKWLGFIDLTRFCQDLLRHHHVPLSRPGEEINYLLDEILIHLDHLIRRLERHEKLDSLEWMSLIYRRVLSLLPALQLPLFGSAHQQLLRMRILFFEYHLEKRIVPYLTSFLHLDLSHPEIFTFIDTLLDAITDVYVFTPYQCDDHYPDWISACHNFSLSLQSNHPPLREEPKRGFFIPTSALSSGEETSLPPISSLSS